MKTEIYEAQAGEGTCGGTPCGTDADISAGPAGRGDGAAFDTCLQVPTGRAQGLCSDEPANLDKEGEASNKEISAYTEEQMWEAFQACESIGAPSSCLDCYHGESKRWQRFPVKDDSPLRFPSENLHHQFVVQGQEYYPGQWCQPVFHHAPLAALLSGRETAPGSGGIIADGAPTGRSAV